MTKSTRTNKKQNQQQQQQQRPKEMAIYPRIFFVSMFVCYSRSLAWLWLHLSTNAFDLNTYYMYTDVSREHEIQSEHFKHDHKYLFNHGL